MSHTFSVIHRAAEHSHARPAASMTPLLQRRSVSDSEGAMESRGACACGGGCPRCAVTSLMQTKPIDGLIQRDFEPHPEHTDEEVFAAMSEETDEKEVTEEEEPVMDMGHMHAKLIVGSQDDPTEREADQVADAVVAGAAAPSVSAAAAGVISRSAVQESGIKPSRSVARYVGEPGAGSALPSTIRSLAEDKLGADFGHVRLHTDARAQAAAASVGARAFTMGANIWLGKGESSNDSRLMAHELTHVVQQGHAGDQQTGSTAGPLQRKVIKSPTKLVDFIEGAAHKTERRTDRVSGVEGPARTHLLVHEDWHLKKHPDPADPQGADINDPFGRFFMDFHHTMMEGFKAAGGSSTTWSATTAPPTGADFSRFSDPKKLGMIKTANNFGNLIVGPHNDSHGYFSGADPEDLGMNDFYWAPRHDVFYKLHLWMDNRYTDWKGFKAGKKSSP